MVRIFNSPLNVCLLVVLCLIVQPSLQGKGGDGDDKKEKRKPAPMFGKEKAKGSMFNLLEKHKKDEVNQKDRPAHFKKQKSTGFIHEPKLDHNPVGTGGIESEKLPKNEKPSFNKKRSTFKGDPSPSSNLIKRPSFVKKRSTRLDPDQDNITEVKSSLRHKPLQRQRRSAVNLFNDMVHRDGDAEKSENESPYSWKVRTPEQQDKLRKRVFVCIAQFAHILQFSDTINRRNEKTRVVDLRKNISLEEFKSLGEEILSKLTHLDCLNQKIYEYIQKKYKSNTAFIEQYLPCFLATQDLIDFINFLKSTKQKSVEKKVIKGRDLVKKYTNDLDCGSGFDEESWKEVQSKKKNYLRPKN